MIELGYIQRYRASLMGLAILWVISFHYAFLVGTPLGALIKNGNLGVDTFVILSAFGLCFSLSKDGGYLHFIKKRVLRIVPTWWVLITAMLLVTVALGRDNYPHSVFQYLCYYSGLGWWFYYDKHPGAIFMSGISRQSCCFIFLCRGSIG